jgi:hypothetical protein
MMTRNVLDLWNPPKFRIAYSHSTMTDDFQHGRPLAIDATAQSASPTEPAFISPPEGAPVYHGFVVLDDVTAEGFILGKITDFEVEPCMEGDAFVIAPDGSRAGLGSLRSSVLQRGHAHRSRRVGSVGRRFLSAYE